MKVLLAFGLAFFLSQTGYSQTISATDKKKLKAKEDTLQLYARFLITDTLTEDRMISDSIFTRTLVRALQIKNSFYYVLPKIISIIRKFAAVSHVKQGKARPVR